MNFDDILGTSATPDAVLDAPDTLTVKECDERLTALAALAPGFSFRNKTTVLARARANAPEFLEPREFGCSKLR